MMETKIERSKFEKIFLRIVEKYITLYDKHAFSISFDNELPILIGTNKNIIKVKIHDSQKTLKRIFTEGSLGIGETYCEGLIEVADAEYKYFLFIFVRAVYDKRILFSMPLADILIILRAKFNRKFFSKESKSKNINAHYSLDDWFDDEKDANQFYLYWLGAHSIQYSCGKWDGDTTTLEVAQENKLRFYAERLGIDENSQGKTLIDLGCGWGGCMFYMAENYGLTCKGLTLSTAQAEYIREEIQKRNLGNRVSVEVEDIHNMQGTYDYVISIGVMEHINDYDDLYKKIAQSLNINGRALIHSMFHTEMFYKADPFLSKYIFPGGATPHIKKNLTIFKKYFRSVDKNDLPKNSYPKTLDCWYERFCTNEKEIRNLLKEKSKTEDIDYAIKIFKHYLTLASCGLSDNHGLVANILVKK